jgi:hypothetical protein
MHFGKRHLDARHVADAERDRDRVEAFVRERQRLGVGVDEGHGVIEPTLAARLASDGEHIGIDVGDGRVRAGAAASIVRNDTSPVPPRHRATRIPDPIWAD